jgi:hypothetical protein
MLLDSGADLKAKDMDGKASLIYLIKYLNMVNNLFWDRWKKD